MTESATPQSVRDKLIIAGLKELNAHGVQNFSVRRIASECGVSCAAPYKHFADKQDFIAAIIDYVNDIWAQRQEEILAECSDSHREQIIEVSLNYIRFLMEKPIYRSVLMLNDGDFNNLYHKKRTQFGSLSQSLEAQLYASSGLDEYTWKRKVMIFRSMIFGAVFLFDNEEFPYNETTMEYLRFAMNREFDAP